MIFVRIQLYSTGLDTDLDRAKQTDLQHGFCRSFIISYCTVVLVSIVCTYFPAIIVEMKFKVRFTAFPCNSNLMPDPDP